MFEVEFVFEFENELGKRVIVYFKSKNHPHSMFGVLLLETDGEIKLELKDGTIYTINKDEIARHRLFKEDRNGQKN